MTDTVTASGAKQSRCSALSGEVAPWIASASPRNDGRGTERIDRRLLKRRFPDFESDDEAEMFVRSADLSEYDVSEMVPVRFELRRQDKSVSLRLPESLLAEVRARAAQAGMPYQRFMRLAVERALQKP